MQIVKDNEAQPRALTDTDIVAGLRHADPEVRQRALEAVFPHGGGAVLMHATQAAAQITATRQVDAGRIFNALLFLSQNVGRHLGLSLSWVQDPEAAMREANKIQVVDQLPGGS